MKAEIGYTCAGYAIIGHRWMYAQDCNTLINICRDSNKLANKNYWTTHES